MKTIGFEAWEDVEIRCATTPRPAPGFAGTHTPMPSEGRPCIVPECRSTDTHPYPGGHFCDPHSPKPQPEPESAQLELELSA
jgi:hypothetical protein